MQITINHSPLALSLAELPNRVACLCVLLDLVYVLVSISRVSCISPAHKMVVCICLPWSRSHLKRVCLWIMETQAPYVDSMCVAHIDAVPCLGAGFPAVCVENFNIVCGERALGVVVLWCWCVAGPPPHLVFPFQPSCQWLQVAISSWHPSRRRPRLRVWGRGTSWPRW